MLSCLDLPRTTITWLVKVIPTPKNAHTWIIASHIVQDYLELALHVPATVLRPDSGGVGEGGVELHLTADYSCCVVVKVVVAHGAYLL